MEHYIELQSHYQTWLKTLGFSPSTVYNYPKMAGYFLAYIQDKGVYHITGLQNSHVSGYAAHLQTRRNMRKTGALSVAHLNKTFEAVDRFLEFLAQTGCQNTPPPAHYRILQTRTQMNRKVKVLTKDEIQTLYGCVTKLFPRLSFTEAEARRGVATLVLDLCYGCGLRKSEACKLLVEDIDLDRKILFVRQAKGYKDRCVPLSESINQRIKVFIYQYRKSFHVKHQRLFPYTPHGMFEYIKKLRRASGLDKDFGLHTLRHSIATHLLQNGMNIEQIARFLGHSTLDSTQIYTHLTNNDEQ